MASVEVLPSPKFQLREAMAPPASVELSVKVAVSPLVVKLKLATGGVLAVETVMDLVIVVLSPPLSVTLSDTEYVPAAA